MNRYKMFLATEHEKGSYFAVLKEFLTRRRNKKGLSENSLQRYFYNLHALGESLDNPAIADIDRNDVRDYIDHCWRRLAPDTMRTLISDVILFFKWVKKKKHHANNLAKGIQPVRQSKRRRRRRRSKAAREDDMQTLMQFLAGKLTTYGYLGRNEDGQLVARKRGWPEWAIKTLRDLFIITFLYETGARAGELSKMGSRTMDEAIAEPSQAYMITLVGKTNDRDRYFTERTAELWRIWSQFRPDENREYAIVGWRQGRDVNNMNTNGIAQMLLRRCKAAGVAQFRSHAIRHAKVKRARRAVGLDMAQVLLDHSNIESTWGYAGMEDEEVLSAAVVTGLQVDLWG